MTTQLRVQFTPNPLTGQPRPRKIRAGAIERYEQALSYLRLELKKDEFVLVPASEFANTFKITRGFLANLHRMGAVERINAEGNQLAYKAKPFLDMISALDIVEECRLSAMGNSAQGEPVATECTEEDTQHPAEVWPSAIYMIGLIKQDNTHLAIPLDRQRPVDPASAMAMMKEMSCGPGDKLVLLQVVEVLESTRVLQPSSL